MKPIGIQLLLQQRILTIFYWVSFSYGKILRPRSCSTNFLNLPSISEYFPEKVFFRNLNEKPLFNVFILFSTFPNIFRAFLKIFEIFLFEFSQKNNFCVFSFFIEWFQRIRISKTAWTRYPVFVWKYTRTSKSIWRPALYQSDFNTAGPVPILIEWHIIKGG